MRDRNIYGNRSGQGAGGGAWCINTCIPRIYLTSCDHVHAQSQPRATKGWGVILGVSHTYYVKVLPTKL